MPKPFVKWAGGKEGELKYILPSLPEVINKYVEPFVGGGALYFALANNDVIKERHINDFSSELFFLYKEIRDDLRNLEIEIATLMHNWSVLEHLVSNYGNCFIKYTNSFIKDGNTTILNDEITAFIYSHSDDFNGLLRAGENVQISNFEAEVRKYLLRKIKRIKKLVESGSQFSENDILDNIETAFKASYYTHVRNLYNQKEVEELSDFFTEAKQSAYFYFLREYCYASMFRYNRKGEFNVPYGGMDYNKKNIGNKLTNIKNDDIPSLLKKTNIGNSDFEEFLNSIALSKNDFVFLDPPYDSEFSEYAKNSFSKKDQTRLMEWAKNTKAKVMIVIKNTEFIYKLYNKKEFKISSFDKKYMVNFNNRNDRKVKHLLITNY